MKLEKAREQAKEQIEYFLLNKCFNKYSDYSKYIKNGHSPHLVYSRIVEIFEDFNLTPVPSYKYFESVRKYLLSDARKFDEENAIKTASEKLSSPEPKKFSYTAHQKRARERTKRVRDPIYEKGYKIIVDMLFNADSKDYLSYQDHYLIAKQMLLQAIGINDDSEYICQTYGITSEQFNEPTNKRFVEITHKYIISCIEVLDFFLKHHIKDLIRENPRSAKWLHDLFGPALERYTPYVVNKKDHSQNRVSKETYKNYLKTFIEFVNGTSPLKLGYTKSNYHHFNTHRIKAVAYILYIVHLLLYGLHDIYMEKEEKEVTDLAKSIWHGIFSYLKSQPEERIQRMALRRVVQWIERSFGDLSLDMSFKEALEKLYSKNK